MYHVQVSDQRKTRVHISDIAITLLIFFNLIYTECSRAEPNNAVNETCTPSPLLVTNYILLLHSKSLVTVCISHQKVA